MKDSLSFATRWLKLLGIVATLYLLLPLVVFDFTSPAVPYCEENHAGRSVAIGPCPRWWVPFAARDIDIPGGFDYNTDGRIFQLWKPLCIVYCKAKGYELPAA